MDNGTAIIKTPRKRTLHIQVNNTATINNVSSALMNHSNPFKTSAWRGKTGE
jgi:hypothetical protein